MTTRRPYAEGTRARCGDAHLHTEQDEKIDADVFRVFERLMRDTALREI